MQRCIDFEPELLQIQTAQEPVLRADVCARALRASQDVIKAGAWVGAQCAWWEGVSKFGGERRSYEMT